MDSFNIYKGYGQLNHLEDQNPTKTQLPKNPNIKPFFTIISITTLTLLSLLLITTLIHHSQTRSQLGRLNSETRSIQLVCNVTQYPNSCSSTLTSTNTKSNPDPSFLFSLSLDSAFREVSILVSLPDSLSHRVTELRTRSALEDCRSLFADALERVNQSVAVVKGHVALSDWVMVNGDVNTWISAAMTDLGTCLDGLEEVESTVVGQVRDKVHASYVCLSNSLAILVNIQNLVDKYRHLPAL